MKRTEIEGIRKGEKIKITDRYGRIKTTSIQDGDRVTIESSSYGFNFDLNAKLILICVFIIIVWFMVNF